MSQTRSRAGSLPDISKTEKRKAEESSTGIHKSRKNLDTNMVCGMCQEEIDKEEVRCFKCGSDYHFDTCSLQESAWRQMSSREKTNWSCFKCSSGSGEVESLGNKDNQIDDNEIICVECNKELQYGVGAKCGKCKNSYHFSCTSIKEQTWKAMSRERKKEWSCHKCQTGRWGTNSRNARTPQDNLDRNTNDKKLDRMFALLEQNSEKLDEFVAEFKSLNKKIDANNDKITSLERELKEKDTKIERLEDRIKKLEKRSCTNAGENKGTHDQTVENVNSLQGELVRLQQYSRKNNFEIQNVPMQNDEDTEDLVLKIANRFEVDLSRHSIEAAHRLPKVRNKHPPIIVQVSSRKLKEEFLQNRKKIVTQDSVTGNGSGELIYVKENLCKFFRDLESSSRKSLKIERGWKHVWYRNYAIMARETDTSPMFKIRHFGDLDGLLSKLDQNRGSQDNNETETRSRLSNEENMTDA